MKKIIKRILPIFALLISAACENELDIENPNAPTLLESVVEEEGFVSFIQGTTYTNGFSRGADWLGNSYFSLPWGYHELMADNVGASAANNQITNIGQPLSVVLDNGTTLTNPTKQSDLIRTFNTRAATGAGNNVLYYQWALMYSLNNACNQILDNADRMIYTGDKATKVNTVKAWCYWWKGYAYAAIGSLYVAGLINDEVNRDPNTPTSTVASNEYVSKETIIATSNSYFNLAKTTLQSITSADDYSDMLGKMIPAICQIGRGGVPNTDMWIRNINTMLARNILVNRLSPFVNNNPNAVITKSLMTPMTSADWSSIISLTTDGVRATDVIFTARSTDAASTTIFTSTGGNVAAQTSPRSSSSTFKISERFLQYFKDNDNRFTNNFVQGSSGSNLTYTDNYVYSTRYSVINGGSGLAGVKVYANRSAGEYEAVVASSYEENALMLAEANIRTGKIDEGLALIDEVRAYEGSGLSAVANTGLDLVQAMNELVSERRVSLVFRGLSFYDNRRWGWSYDTSLGGGVYGQFIRNSNVNYTNCQVNYNFVDFWDVPADEIELNPPSASSVSVRNPNY